MPSVTLTAHVNVNDINYTLYEIIYMNLLAPGDIIKAAFNAAAVRASDELMD